MKWKSAEKRRVETENIADIFMKGKKENLWNCGSVSRTLVPGKVMEQIILETISTHVMEKKVMQSIGL